MSTAYRTGSSRSSSGRSRAQQSRGSGGSRSASAGRGTGSAGSRRDSGYRDSGYRNSNNRNTGYRNTGYRNQSGRRSHRRRRRKSSPNYGLIAIIGVVLILVIAAVAFALTQKPDSAGKDSTESKEAVTTSVPETELVKDVMVDGIKITGFSREQAKEAILKNYPWSMKVTYKDDTYEMANLMSGKVDALLEEIFTGTPKESYSLDTSGLDDAVAAQVAAMKDRWNKSPKNGSISGYDASSGNFTFADGENGVEIDEEKLTADIQKAIRDKDFSAQIQVSAASVEPEISRASAQSLYKTIGTFTTKTTANSKRNTNVGLAAKALNGTIIQPGQELSFNDTVGERTEEKGYQSAAAYNNGEVVQEIGGGVCQVSTTLYNAVVASGLKVSQRQSHTFEPTYVTPGMDATVSWGGPDFKFINTSKAAIGIKASFYDRTMTVSIYGIPVLEEGVTQALKSEKIEDLEPPAPTYEEDQTLQPDEEVTVSSGSKGSRWETRLVVKKNGEVVSSNVDHTTKYKGHAPVIKRNTSGTVIPSETESTAEGESASGAETTAASSEGESSASPTIPAGPGESASEPQQVQQPTTAPAAPAEGSAGPAGPGQSGSQVVAPPSVSPGGSPSPSPGPGSSGGDMPVVAPPIP